MKFLMLLLICMTVSCGRESAQGFGGDMTISVSIKNKQIHDIKVISHKETEAVGGQAFPILKKSILNSQTSEVDNVSGATHTSQAYRSAVAKALAKANFIPESTSNINTVSKTEDIDTDVLIIGGGGAGLSAAISAKEQGVDVIVIDKMGILGGNTLYTTEISNKNLKTLEWLEDNQIDLNEKGKNSDRVGFRLIMGLLAKARELDIQMLVNTRATGFIINRGQVRGIRVSDKEHYYNINAKSVIIATGGFGNNNNKISSYRSDLRGFHSSNHKGATGDFFDSIDRVNIKLESMMKIQVHPTGDTSKPLIISTSLRDNGALLINSKGNRFVNELDSDINVSKAIMSQGGTAYLIYDEQIRNNLEIIKDYENLGSVHSGNTINALASSIEVNPSALTKTITDFNRYVDTGIDNIFKRMSFGTKIVEPSFYAIAVTPVTHHTAGGIGITTNNEVSYKNGNIIKGLYAVGEVTSQEESVSDVITSGIKSGISAVEFVKNN